jgi:hypothetical protein
MAAATVMSGVPQEVAEPAATDMRAVDHSLGFLEEQRRRPVLYWKISFRTAHA